MTRAQGSNHAAAGRKMPSAQPRMPGPRKLIQRQLSGNARCCRRMIGPRHSGHAQRKFGEPMLSGSSSTRRNRKEAWHRGQLKLTSGSSLENISRFDVQRRRSTARGSWSGHCKYEISSRVGIRISRNRWRDNTRATQTLPRHDEQRQGMARRAKRAVDGPWKQLPGNVAGRPASVSVRSPTWRSQAVRAQAQRPAQRAAQTRSVQDFGRLELVVGQNLHCPDSVGG
jgi:hypothetical protein